MKIVFLSLYNGLVYRGNETFVHELANGLTDLDNEVTVFQGGPKLPGSKYQTITIEVPIDLNHKNSTTPFFGYYPWNVRKFTQMAVKQFDPDLDILFPTNNQWQALLCKIWAVRHKKKVVISGQSGPGLEDRFNLWLFPDVFLALTEFQKQWARKINPFIHLETIPNGVNLKEFSSNIPPSNLGLAKPVILCVGALEPFKRIDLVIKAVSKLAVGSLVIVGKGSQYEYLNDLGQKLLADRLKILAVPHDKILPIYKAADIFTFATVPWESFGIVLVEAMASGLPVVTSDDPIRREIVGEAGIYVDPTNSEIYSKALNKAMEKKWGNTPQKQAKKFSWDKIAQEYHLLFAKLIRS